MKMEAGLVEQRMEIVGPVSDKILRKKTVKKRPSSSSSSATTIPSKRRFSVCLPLQELYSCCKNVFRGPGFVPPPEDVQSLRNILDRMKPEDLGLSRDLQFFKTESSDKEIQRVKCTTIYKCRSFSLVLFFLPASAVIPLHNHPEMTVFSKLLLGKMHIKAYDWVDPVDLEHREQTSSLRLAKLKANDVFTAPCNTSVLYPTSGGNIHAFTAITPCAVLDVLGPPYSKEDGRDCSYYKETAYAPSDGKLASPKDDEPLYGWLEEIDVPEQSKMDGIEYLGPRIIEIAD